MRISDWSSDVCSSDLLLQIVAIKRLCREAGIEKIDAGPKGVVIAFRNNAFANPAGLIGFIQKEHAAVKLRPDHRLVYTGRWSVPQTRLAGVRRIAGELVRAAAG